MTWGFSLRLNQDLNQAVLILAAVNRRLKLESVCGESAWSVQIIIRSGDGEDGLAIQLEH